MSFDVELQLKCEKNSKDRKFGRCPVIIPPARCRVFRIRLAGGFAASIFPNQAGKLITKPVEHLRSRRISR